MKGPFRDANFSKRVQSCIEGKFLENLAKNDNGTVLVITVYASIIKMQFQVS